VALGLVRPLPPTEKAALARAERDGKGTRGTWAAAPSVPPPSVPAPSPPAPPEVAAPAHSGPASRVGGVAAAAPG